MNQTQSSLKELSAQKRNVNVERGTFMGAIWNTRVKMKTVKWLPPPEGSRKASQRRRHISQVLRVNRPWSSGRERISTQMTKVTKEKATSCT